MPSAEEIREQQLATWAGLSAGWEKWDSVIMDQLAPVGEAMIERLQISEDQQHLDIAAGTGEPGLSIARLSPSGRVVLTDLVAEMLDIAARRAEAQGVANVATTVCSADDLPFADATFDSVSVRFGYMFFPDLAEATAEFARVLRPGGRLCASVWVKPEENPWTTIAMQAIATEAVLAPPDPNGPNMFRCAAPGYVSALYEAAGLRDVAEWDVDVELVATSPAQYWEMISEHVSLAVAALQRVDEPARERIRATAIAKVRAFEKHGEVQVPGVARCIVGTRPDPGWDARYRERDGPMWSGRPNGRLVAEVADVAPGRALDVGCGEGADAIWLARRGWAVTAIDVSDVAVSRAREAAELAGASVEWICADALQTPVPAEAFDLVSMQYPALPKSAGEAAVRRLLDAVRPGGLLLAVYHDLDDEHRQHMKSRGVDPSDYVGVDDVARLLGDDFTVELHAIEPRIDPPPGTPHVADVVLRARRR